MTHTVTSISYVIPFDSWAPVTPDGEYYDVAALEPVRDAVAEALFERYPKADISVGLDHSEYCACDFRAVFDGEPDAGEDVELHWALRDECEELTRQHIEKLVIDTE